MNPFDNPKIQNAAAPFHFNAGEVIMLAEEVPDYAYFLAEGEALVRELTPAGNWRILHHIKVGEAFGHYEIISGRRLLCSVFARADCSGIRIPANVFLKLLKTDSEVSFQILRGLTEILNIHSFDRVSRAGNRAVVRVADCIANNEQNGVVSLTRQEIAESTRCALRTVHRAVKQLAERGLIRNNFGVISVPNPAALEQYINSILS